MTVMPSKRTDQTVSPDNVATLIRMVGEIGSQVGEVKEDIGAVKSALDTHIQVQDANAVVRKETCPHLEDIQKAHIDVDAVAGTMRQHNQDSDTYKRATERTLEALTGQIETLDAKITKLSRQIEAVRNWYKGGKWVAVFFVAAGGFALGRWSQIVGFLKALAN